MENIKENQNDNSPTNTLSESLAKNLDLSSLQERIQSLPSTCVRFGIICVIVIGLLYGVYLSSTAIGKLITELAWHVSTPVSEILRKF